jgi:serine/threonine protein kinase
MPHRYKIYEALGQGGSATVFRAYDSQMKRWVAIKRLIGPNGDIGEAAELKREANTLAGLASTHIVTVFDTAEDELGLFMVMEILQGPDLQDLLEAGPLSIEDFRELALQTLGALSTCHEHRIIHRDLKPSNIKIDRDPSGRLIAKIIDFGISRTGMIARKQTERSDGMIQGTVNYMAPEQLARTACDHRADLYSLGCIFYECLCGRRPVESPNVFEMIDKHLKHDITSLQVLASHLPLKLIGWVETGLMALSPEDRYQSALEAMDTLTELKLASVKTKVTTKLHEPSQPLVSAETQPSISRGAWALIALLLLSAIALYFTWERPIQEASVKTVRATSPSQRRSLPRATDIIVHCTAEHGCVGFGETPTATPVALLGDPVQLWQDIGPLADQTPLRTYQTRAQFAPRLIGWAHESLHTGIRALHFAQPEGSSASMTLKDNQEREEDFAFGTDKTGLTLALVLQADGSHLPQRIGRLVSNKAGSLSVVVDTQKRFVLEARSSAVGSSATIVAEGVAATDPSVILVHWDSASTELRFVAVSCSGGVFRSPPVKCLPFAKPLRNVELGRVHEFGGQKPAAPADQFHGWLGEFIYYPSPLKLDQLPELETALTSHYFVR